MGQPEGVQPQKKTNWRHWALGIAVVLVLIIIIQNAQEVKVDFLFVHTKTPLIFALVIAALLGALIGWLVPRVRRHERD